MIYLYTGRPASGKSFFMEETLNTDLYVMNRPTFLVNSDDLNKKSDFTFSGMVYSSPDKSDYPDDSVFIVDEYDNRMGSFNSFSSFINSCIDDENCNFTFLICSQSLNIPSHYIKAIERHYHFKRTENFDNTRLYCLDNKFMKDALNRSAYPIEICPKLA